MTKPKHLDLHTGIGGFALAARWSGYETVGFSEIEPYCNDLLSKRFPRIPNFGDIRKFCKRTHDCVLAPGDVDDDAAEPWCPVCDDYFGNCDCVGADQFTDENGWPDVITSGFPCQDISVNGEGAGLDGARSGLWRETCRITDELQPPFLIFENVAALKTRGIDTIATHLETLGYALGTIVVPGYAVGAAHQRERVFAVAHLAGKRIQGVRPEGLQEPHPLARSPLSLRTRDGQWEVEPDLRRAPDGIPGGMDGPPRNSERVKALGNAIIPQIACALFDILPYLAEHNQLNLTNCST